ncbi:MAG TPA: CHAT domain-containing protein [Thermoanaerobaculia bacterium]|nr:CHAT domain-containing protein [Thermoanaerobaculia bacterium]
MTDTRTTLCPDAETLAAFAEGKLKRREIPDVLVHLDTCTICTAALEGANDRVAAQSRPRTLWLATAAAVFLVVAGVSGWWIRERNPEAPAARLVALAPRDGRTVEPRLSGGFAWAPYRGPMRASATAEDAGRYKLAGAVGELLEQADRDPSPRAQQAAGTGLVLVERAGDAVVRLRAAAAREPSNAKMWNDVGAAEYAAALYANEPSRYAEALAALDRAVALDPGLAEAHFNRALTRERLGLTAAAREAWEHYLALDASSPWAAEARAHLQRLPSKSGQSLFRDEQPRLERAAIGGDAKTVRELVAKFPQQARTFGETEYLGRWAEAEQRGDRAEAARQLSIARAIGEVLLAKEALLRDAVANIDAAGEEQRAALAAAHVLYRNARLAYSRSAPVAAGPGLRRAAALFSASANPMALVARYYAANTRFDQNDVAGARRELEMLLAEADARPQYAALGAQVRWELALCAMNDDDWEGALPLLTAAEETFRTLGESAYLAFVETLLGDTLVSLGRPDEGWAARIRSFEALTADGRVDRLAVGIGGAVRVELRRDRLDAARALAELEMAALRVAGNDAILAEALMRGAVLKTELGDEPAAWKDVREAEAAVRRIADPAMRERALADVRFARGAVQVAGNPRAAAAALAEAIDGYLRAGAPLFVPESHLLRARALLRLGDRDAALRDVERGLAVHERHRAGFAAAVAGTGVHDAGAGLYREAIRLSLDRGDLAAAFAFSERSLSAGTGGDLRALQQRLAGSGATVVELVLLDRELVAFHVTATDAAVHRQPLDGLDFAALGEAACGGDGDAARRLYDVLIRPAAPQLAGARRLIVVADPLLEAIPFAALIDSTSRQRLVERLPVAVAPSAGALVRQPAAIPETIVAVGVGSGLREAALPASRAELDELTRYYRQSIDAGGVRATFGAVIDAASRADVVHISGHAEPQGRAGEAAMVFSGPRQGMAERVSWRRVAAQSLHGDPVVVLAACETLRASRSRYARTLSLGGGFLAAGAGDVIGTLVPIPDNDARAIFGRVHRHLAQGVSAADALRLAQLESLAAEARGEARTAWRSVALLTRRIPVRKENPS